MPTASQPSRPPHRARKYLRRINGGPWLDNYESTRCAGTLAIGGGMLALVSAILGQHPQALVGFWVAACGIGGMLVVFCGLGCLASVLARAATQTCPECLCDMPRGATTCPHCHFHPPQGVM